MITGRFPRAVEMHLHRIPASSLPQDAEGLHQWCREGKWVRGQSIWWVVWMADKRAE